MAKDKRAIQLTRNTTICPGVWSVTLYDDGTRKAVLSERWDTPLLPSDLATEAQREAQAEYEREVGARAKGR